MKKISILTLLFLVAGFILLAQNDPTIMTINGKPIPKSDFEYIYKKNNSNNVIDKKTLNEYVDMFVDFKLKVEEAIAQGIDTTKSFKSEFGSYRDQLAAQYLSDEDNKEELIKEAYQRMKTELEVSHILLQIPASGTSADTLQTYNKAMEIYKRSEKENFGKLAAELSDDPSAKNNQGYVGWITTLRTPYEIERAAYNTPVGEVSKPVRTFIGYHIIKVTGRRPSPGKVKVAHIMLIDDPNNPEVKEKNKERIDSIYQRILSGDNFGKLATLLSQDVGSARQQGELPWFGAGQMIPKFEEQAFAMTDTGTVSKPIHSHVGWHIIKLIDKKPLGSYDEMKSEIQKQLARLNSNRQEDDLFINKLKEEYDFSENKIALADYYQLVDRVAPNDSLFPKEVMKLNRPILFTIAGNHFTQADFNRYLIGISNSYRGVRSDFIKNTYGNYVHQEIKNFEKSQLPRKYPEYRNLVNEYHDGILLFEVMNKQVWEKASTDTEGLKGFFEKNSDNYTWKNPRYKGYVVYAKDKATLNAAKKITKYANFDSIAHYLPERLNDTIQYVKVEKGIWEKGSNPVIDYKVFKGAKYTPDNDFSQYFILGKKMNKPEEYTDVKGKVTADYQEYLEKEWVASLRKKYPVVINQQVLQTVEKD